MFWVAFRLCSILPLFYYLFHHGFDLQFGQNRVNSHRGSGDVLSRSLQQDSLTKKTRKFLRRNEDVNTKANVNKFDFLLNTFTKYCYILLSLSAYVLTWYFSSYELKQQLSAGATRHRAVHASLMVSHIHIAVFLSFENWDLLQPTKLEDWPAVNA